MGASPSQDWNSTRFGGHVLPRRAALGAGRDPAGKLSDVAAAHSPAGATSAWRPKGASSGALQAFPKPPIQGQRRSRRVDLTSYCVLKCRCFPLANVDGPLHRVPKPLVLTNLELGRTEENRSISRRFHRIQFWHRTGSPNGEPVWNACTMPDCGSTPWGPGIIAYLLATSSATFPGIDSE